ncbi:hypothetical protein C8R44DRAFT_866915 [Mycena epipterygia]|nr:hypothetical protein C8R44DRAFT_866915 [Mycena epipterygia]
MLAAFLKANRTAVLQADRTAIFEADPLLRRPASFAAAINSIHIWVPFGELRRPPAPHAPRVDIDISAGTKYKYILPVAASSSPVTRTRTPGLRIPRPDAPSNPLAARPPPTRAKGTKTPLKGLKAALLLPMRLPFFFFARAPPVLLLRACSSPLRLRAPACRDPGMDLAAVLQADLVVVTPGHSKPGRHRSVTVTLVDALAAAFSPSTDALLAGTLALLAGVVAYAYWRWRGSPLRDGALGAGGSGGGEGEEEAAEDGEDDEESEESDDLQAQLADLRLQLDELKALAKDPEKLKPGLRLMVQIAVQHSSATPARGMRRLRSYPCPLERGYPLTLERGYPYLLERETHVTVRQLTALDVALEGWSTSGAAEGWEWTAAAGAYGETRRVQARLDVDCDDDDGERERGIAWIEDDDDGRSWWGRAGAEDIQAAPVRVRRASASMKAGRVAAPIMGALLWPPSTHVDIPYYFQSQWTGLRIGGEATRGGREVASDLAVDCSPPASSTSSSWTRRGTFVGGTRPGRRGRMGRGGSASSLPVAPSCPHPCGRPDIFRRALAVFVRSRAAAMALGPARRVLLAQSRVPPRATAISTPSSRKYLV